MNRIYLVIDTCLREDREPGAHSRGHDGVLSTTKTAKGLASGHNVVHMSHTSQLFLQLLHLLALYYKRNT